MANASITPKTIASKIKPKITCFFFEKLQESLDYLRLSVKYLVFDLEATRRENAYLRRLVEQGNRGSAEGGFLDDES